MAVKILEIVADGSPGGGTTNVLGLIEDIQRARSDSATVHFISDSSSFALERAGQLGARCYGVNFFRSRLDFFASRKLAKLIDRIKPDLIHVHGGRAAFFLSLTSAPSRIPTVYTVRGFHFLHKDPVTRFWAVTAERWISRRVARTVLVCNYDLALGHKWRLFGSGHKCSVIYNGINRAVIPTGGKQNPKTVGWLGRFDYQKDPQFVVAVAEILAREGYRFKLIGGGDLEPDVKRQISDAGLGDAVTITGSLSHKEALAELSTVSSFILPSRWEGLPIAPVEAMWMKIPVVASSVSGIPEIIETDINGILIDERDPAQYAAAIRRIDTTPDLRARFVAAGISTIKEKFLRERNAAAYLDLYDELKVPSK